MSTYYKRQGRIVSWDSTDAKVVSEIPVVAGTPAPVLQTAAQFDALPEPVKKAIDTAVTEHVQLMRHGALNMTGAERQKLWNQAQRGRWAYSAYNADPNFTGKEDDRWTVEYGDQGLTAQKLGLGDSKAQLDLPGCRHPRGSRVYELRQLLVGELNKIAPKDGTADTCLQVCDEDGDMLKMMNQYETLAKKKMVGKCTLASFDKDPKLKLLAAKREMLKRMTFAYLHAECEGTNRCNPYGDDNCVKPSLIPCSGLLEADSLLFGDDELAGIGREIAGKQRHGDSPAARGFAANLFQTNTLAPGAKRKDGEASVWVNVCYPVVDSLHSFSAPTGKLDASADGMTMAVKWIEANAMETSKYYTLQALDAAIRKQKRRILAVNRQMLTLQSRLAQIAPGDALGYADEGYGDAMANMEMFVGTTVGGVKNALIARQAEKSMKQSREKLDLQMSVAPVENRREYQKQMRRMGLAGRSRSRSKSKRSRSRSRSSKRGGGRR